MANEKEEAGQEQSKKSFTKWLIIGIIIPALAGGTYFGWIKFIKKPQESQPAEMTKTEVPEPINELVIGQNFSLQNFVVNLSDTGGKRYLKTKIELEFTQQTLKEELTARLPQLRDLALFLLSSKTFDQVQDIDGKIDLKNELIFRINQVLTNGKIKNLYFTEFVIQ